MAGRKTRKGWWMMPLLAFMLLYGAITYTSQSEELYLINLKITELEQKIEKEKEIKRNLQKQKEEISSEESIEKLAREKLGMVKDGEKIFIDINK
ncbi:MAG: cell division protein FtsL [Clostridiaceae bacterium]|nr:cell division protein FtsL [Clostridiaceae bacterium]